MAFCEIISENIIVKINTKGAEVCDLHEKGRVHNWIWAAAEPWGRSAPHLFPIVGKLSQNTYRYENQAYNLSQHGFARDQEFEIIAQQSSLVKLRLAGGAYLKKSYPFNFIFEVCYQVHKAVLTVRYRLINIDARTMYFNIGWHPGFVLPEQALLPLVLSGNRKFGDCCFLQNGLLDLKTCIRSEELIRKIEANSFDRDAWVFVEEVPERLSIADSAGNAVFINTGGASYLGVWSKDPAKFICVEPWWGVADLIDASGDFSEKYGIQSLEPKKEWGATMTVEIRRANESN